MKLEILRLDEYHLLEPIYKAEGGRINPDLIIIGVMKEGDEIIGMAALETVLHVGPIWVKEGYRGRGIMPTIIKYLESKILGPGYYMFPSNSSSRSVCKQLGMKSLGEVWVKEF